MSHSTPPSNRRSSPFHFFSFSPFHLLTASPFPLFSFSPLLLLSVSLFTFFIYLSSRAQAHPTITPDQAIALALGDIEPVGDNFRISDMGGDVLYDTELPTTAFNSVDNQYLVVWSGDDNTGGLIDEQAEIFGQLIDGETGVEIGSDFRISHMGPAGDINVHASAPAVIYNPTGNEYFVVWHGYKDSGGLVTGEYEIFGQRLDAPTGLEIGSDFRISDMGPDGNASYDAFYPAVAFNISNNQYFIVWYADDDIGGLVNDEAEIFGQRLDASTGDEIGINDFRISDMGPDGNANFDAVYPGTVFNSIENEYYVIWQGDDNTDGLADNEVEIFGQRIDGPSGQEIGGDFRISDVGIDGDPNSDARSPSLTYNSTDNEYLAVWEGDDATGGMVDNENEIFGQRVNGTTGEEIGNNDFRISDLGPDGDATFNGWTPSVIFNIENNEFLVIWYGDDQIDGEGDIFAQRISASNGLEIGINDFKISDMGTVGDPNFDARNPSVSYNFIQHEYLVAWEGDDNTNGLIDEEFEIFAQRLDSTGTEIGADDFRVSDMGGDVMYDAYAPKVTYNSTNNQYLVVWQGDDNAVGLADEENEIFGQLIDANTGVEIGTDFRISDMGPDGDASYNAYEPNLAYNPNANEYLVVWEGDDNTGTLIEDEIEIFGQRIDALTGAETGPNDFRISNMGPDGNALYDAYAGPEVVFNPGEDEYLVVWFGDAGTGGLVDNEREIFGQRLDGDTGAEIGIDFRISDMGPDGDISFTGDWPAVAYNAMNNEYLVVWYGDDDLNGLVDEEYEIFGQRLNGATGVEVGTNDFRISDMGPDADQAYRAYFPDVTYNPLDNEYLIVWVGDDNINGLVDNEYEIFGQRLDAATGTETGLNDFRISSGGPDGDSNYLVDWPAVIYTPTEHEFWVVWQGEDHAGGMVDDENEVFGQRLDATTGSEVENEFRITHAGPDGNPAYDAYRPAVVYNFIEEMLLVVWTGDDNVNGLITNEFEVFGQFIQYLTLTPTPTNTPTPTPTPTFTPSPTPMGTPGMIYLPLALRPIPCLSPYTESEPNGPPQTDADGPLCLNQVYTASPNDSWDYFTFILDHPDNLLIEINNHPLAGVNGAQVQLYYQAVSPANKVGEAITPPYQIEYTAQAGTYYLIVFTDTSKCGSCEQPYTLQINDTSLEFLSPTE